MGSNYPNGFAHGLTVRNVPITLTPGASVFWVDSNGGSDGNRDGTFDKPYASIDYAVGKCTADKGDVILCKPGHAETLDAAADIDLDVSGISVIALGNGTNRATLTFTADTADIDIDAANILFKNFRIYGGVASLAAPIDVNAAHFTIEDCDFYSTGAGYGILIGIITDANANDLTVRNCSANLLVATDGTTAITQTSTEFIRLVGADRALIENNYISGDFTTAAINAVTTACKDIKVLNNYIYNIATENIAGGIDIVAASTGYVAGNFVYVAYTSGTTFIDASSCALGNNYVSNALGTEAPALFGTLDSTDALAKTSSDLVVTQSDVKTVLSNLVVAKSDIVAALSNIVACKSDLVVLQASEDSDMVVLKSDIAGLRAGTTSDVVVLKALLTTATSDLVVIQASEDSDMVVLKSDVVSCQSNIAALKSDFLIFITKYASDNP